MRLHYTITANATYFDVQSISPGIELGGNGFIIGYLFRKDDSNSRVIELSDVDIDEAIKSTGKSLIEKFWGGYIAIIRSNSGSIILIRDPSGIVPCYWRLRDGEVMVSNDIEDVACWGGPAAVKISELARYLASPGYNGNETGLEGVFELVAGTSLIIGADGPEVSTLWSPWTFALEPIEIAPSEAATQLRDVITKCVGAWAGCFENVLLGVSGGLDSSIVACCAEPHTQLRCLNLFADDAEGDERRYATLLTDKFGLRLDTSKFDISEINIRDAVLPHRPWPNASFFALGIEARHQRSNRELPVGAFFSGNGGDNIFCSLRSASPFLDRLFVEGPGFGLTKTLGDICRLTETDTASVLKAAWQQYLKLRKPVQPKVDLAGFSRRANLAPPFQHPWKSPPAGALPGKIGHVASLAGAQQSHELYAAGMHPPHIAVLLSQPIVELCLSFPTWLWVDGGMNRAVARRAFQADLPDQLVQRSSKGGPGGFMREIYRTNADAIKEIILYGKLVAGGFVDVEYIDAADDPTWRGISRAQRLLQFAAAENWCRYWDGRSKAD